MSVLVLLSKYDCVIFGILFILRGFSFFFAVLSSRLYLGLLKRESEDNNRRGGVLKESEG